jgi:hypothetical protein
MTEKDFCLRTCTGVFGISLGPFALLPGGLLTGAIPTAFEHIIVYQVCLSVNPQNVNILTAPLTIVQAPYATAKTLHAWYTTPQKWDGTAVLQLCAVLLVLHTLLSCSNYSCTVALHQEHIETFVLAMCNCTATAHALIGLHNRSYY